MIKGDRITLRELRRDFGDEAMETFLKIHTKLGFEFCTECHAYVRMEEGSPMCDECASRIQDDDE